MIEIILSDFIMRSLLAGVLLALPLGIMGCFLVWRRMAFLGDTLGHGTVLGVALGLLFHLDFYLSVIGLIIIMAFLLSKRSQNHFLGMDTWMSILSYSSLALGLILLSLNRQNRVDPDSILFGDLLAISSEDLSWAAIMASIVILIAFKNWRNWLLMTLDEDLAETSGVSLMKQRLLFILMIAFVISIGMKLIGALLLPALMVLPSATVARFSKGPEQMVVFATLTILLSYFGGFYASFEFDTPTGPTIIVMATILFVVGIGLGKLGGWSKKLLGSSRNF